MGDLTLWDMSKKVVDPNLRGMRAKEMSFCFTFMAYFHQLTSYVSFIAAWT